MKTVYALVSLLVILIAGLIPFRKRAHKDHLDFPIGETLATGVFLGAAFLHMLPEANQEFHELGYQYPWANIITGSIFLFFLWFEHVAKELYHHKESSHPAFALLAWAMLSLHSFMLGAALGLSNSSSLAFMLFLAIIVHKWAESFALAVQLNKSSLTTKQSLLFFLSFSLMTPVGIFLGWYLQSGMQTHSIVDPILIAASAGTFLYLGTLHGLERCVMVERCCNLRDFSYVIIGFGLMAAAAFYV